jgi:5-methylcytosine-specific restriction protein B
MDKELEKNYDDIVSKLFLKTDNKYHVLKTLEGNKFKIIKSSQNNVVVIPFTDIATKMTISKYEISLYLEKGKANYDSYTRVILPYIKGEKSFDNIEVVNNDYQIENNELSKKSENKNMKTKNIMLYGSPGVGKTHNYKRLITMIEDDDEKTIFDTISKNETTNDFDNSVFETIKKEKRIEFITFHQSYSYEDFIEGFRPQKNGVINREDGIFKILCCDARNNLDDTKLTLEEFNEKYNLLREFRIYAKERVENQKFIKSSNVEFRFKKFDKDVLYFTRVDSDKYFLDSFITFDSITKSFKQTLNDIYDEDTAFICSDFKIYMKKLNMIIPYIEEYKLTRKEKNFYIVIDEINRGNISKIFGELITLIEEDKRDNYEVTLPYSKEKFKIPSNLYIIATMNSTDKSIATIDIALRRRFTFLKMKPNLDLVENQEAKKLMEDLNKHISKTINEDYALGHSYFMNIKDDNDLEFVKEYKIKPLLEEYFYGDEENYKKAITILGLENEPNKQ